MAGFSLALIQIKNYQEVPPKPYVKIAQLLSVLCILNFRNISTLTCQFQKCWENNLHLEGQDKLRRKLQLAIMGCLRRGGGGGVLDYVFAPKASHNIFLKQ